jgi:hypothetical protein
VNDSSKNRMPKVPAPARAGVTWFKTGESIVMIIYHPTPFAQSGQCLVARTSQRKKGVLTK